MLAAVIGSGDRTIGAAAAAAAVVGHQRLALGWPRHWCRPPYAYTFSPPGSVLPLTKLPKDTTLLLQLINKECTLLLTILNVSTLISMGEIYVSTNPKYIYLHSTVGFWTVQKVFWTAWWKKAGNN